MSMTREEAIKWLEETIQDTDTYWESCSEAFQKELDEQKEVFNLALTALRPITREQVKKVWRGKWIGTTDDDGCTWYECSRCEHDLDSLEDPNHFCPACGAPMTDEAVEIVMERLEVLGYGKDD